MLTWSSSTYLRKCQCLRTQCGVCCCPSPLLSFLHLPPSDSAAAQYNVIMLWSVCGLSRKLAERLPKALSTFRRQRSSLSGLVNQQCLTDHGQTLLMSAEPSVSLSTSLPSNVSQTPTSNTASLHVQLLAFSKASDSHWWTYVCVQRAKVLLFVFLNQIWAKDRAADYDWIMWFTSVGWGIPAQKLW